ncbi:MAG: hypothetical protein EA398_00890 [Deltaproteobacteria bacterium]|nr:MAG: hypothetical protein EA398_00890 [Deltaproteobacteria bacterium]
MTSPLDTLYAAWVEPDTEARRRFPVAQLERSADPDGQVWMQLRYLAGVHGALERGFQTFPGMEDLTTTYRVRDTFFLVRQRIMRPSRPDYGDWIASLGWPDGFDAANDPFRVLVRSGGRNATDRLEFFAPIPLGEGRWRFEFFVRYVRGNEALAPLLAAGQRPKEPLRIVMDTANPHDPQTLAIHDADGETIGYVPAYYNRALHAADRLPDTIEILALNPSPESSAHRLLVACEAELPRDWDITRSHPELAPLPAE